MATKKLSLADKCSKFISALKEDKERINDIVHDDIEHSKAYVMAKIPDGGVVDYNDNNDTIEYAVAHQAPREYQDLDASPRPLVEGEFPGRDVDGRTGLFANDSNEIDPNACAGTCEFRFGQGFREYGTKDYRLQLSTPDVCAKDYIRMGARHVAGFFKGMKKQFADYGMMNYEANLLNMVIMFGEANGSVLDANHFELSTGGVPAPPKHRVSIHYLRQYRQYMIREMGVDENGYLEVSMPREDWREAVALDQLKRFGQQGQTSFNTTILDGDEFGKLQGRESHVYDGIRCVFDEMPIRGYYKPTGTNSHDFVRIYHWKNEINESGGLSAEPNHDYDSPWVYVDGQRHEVVTLIPIINRKSFKRYGLGAAKKFAGSAPSSQNYTVEVRDGSWIENNDFNDKFRLIARHEFRFKVMKGELSGVIAYRHSRPEGYINPVVEVTPDLNPLELGGPENYENCMPGAADTANCDCVGEITDDNGGCVPVGTKAKVNLEPCGTVDTVFTGDAYQLVLNVTREGTAVGTGTVDVAFANGTASEGTHFTLPITQVTWQDGEFGAINLPVDILDVPGATGDFTLTLENATGDLELGDCVSIVVTIIDGQTP